MELLLYKIQITYTFLMDDGVNMMSIISWSPSLINQFTVTFSFSTVQLSFNILYHIPSLSHKINFLRVSMLFSTWFTIFTSTYWIIYGFSSPSTFTSSSSGHISMMLMINLLIIYLENQSVKILVSARKANNINLWKSYWLFTFSSLDIYSYLSPLPLALIL